MPELSTLTNAIGFRRLMVSRIGYPNEFLKPTAGTNTTFGSSISLMAAPQANWRDVEIAFGNFGINYDAGPNTLTVRAAIEYAANSGIYTPIFGPTGSRDIVIEPDTFVRCRIPFTILAGAQFNIRLFGSVPASGKWATSDLNFYASAGDRYEEGSTDKTLSGSIAGAAGARIPACILSVTGVPDANVVVPAIAISGDSISVGSGESTSTIERGFVVRALQVAYPWVHLGQAGGSLNGLFTTTGLQQGRWRRRSAVCLDGVTHVLCNLGTNDIGTSADKTAEETITYYQALNDDLRRRSIKLIPMTILPRTDSANSGGFYTSTVPITDTITQWNRRDTLNAWVRTNPFGFGYFDATSYAEDPNDRTRWRSDLGSPTADGLHPSPAVHAAIAAGMKTKLAALLV